MISRAPWSFAVACVAASAIIWAALYFAYGRIIDAKDATIQAKESERDRYKSEVERLEKELSKIKPNWREDASPLKKRAEILAAQLSEFATVMATNTDSGTHLQMCQAYEFRFATRVEKLRNALDESGVHSELIDRAAGINNFGMMNQSGQNAATTIKQVANEFLEITKGLKD